VCRSDWNPSQWQCPHESSALARIWAGWSAPSVAHLGFKNLRKLEVGTEPAIVMHTNESMSSLRSECRLAEPMLQAER